MSWTLLLLSNRYGGGRSSPSESITSIVGPSMDTSMMTKRSRSSATACVALRARVQRRRRTRDSGLRAPHGRFQLMAYSHPKSLSSSSRGLGADVDRVVGGPVLSPPRGVRSSRSLRSSLELMDQPSSIQTQPGGGTTR